jgi:hypothetical protein
MTFTREVGLSLEVLGEAMTLPKLLTVFRTDVLTKFILLEVMVPRKVLL